jgi:hypothetical protein
MQAKYEDKKIKLTDRYIKAVKELLQAELEMMANYDKDYSDCWVKGFAVINDLACVSGIEFIFSGDGDDWSPLKTEPGQVIIEVKRRLKKNEKKSNA